jgi:hypothetical protein
MNEIQFYLLLQHLQLAIEISTIRNSSTVSKTKASSLSIILYPQLYLSEMESEIHILIVLSKRHNTQLSLATKSITWQ